MSTPNPFDKFDTTAANPFDQFDAPKPPPDNALTTGIKRAAGGVIGDVNQVINAVNSPIKGLAGVYGLIKGAVTPGDSADNSSADMMQSAGIPTIGGQGDKAVQEGIDASQQATGAILNAPINIYRAGTDALDTINNKMPWAPYVNNFVNNHPFLVKAQAALKGAGDTAVQAAPILYGAYKGMTATPEVPNLTAKQQTLKLANDNGVSIVPSEAEIQGGVSAPMGTTLEGFTGGAKAAQALAIKNVKSINGMAAQELSTTAPDLGITPTTELTPEIISKAKQANVEPYEIAANLSKTYGPVPMDAEYASGLQALEEANKANRANPNPDITDMLESINKPSLTTKQIWGEIQRLRGNATGNYKVSSGAPAKNSYDVGDLADAQSAAADLLEDRLDRFAQTIPGQEDLVPKLQQARVNFAKINAIDNSIKKGTTDVNPGYFGKQLTNGAPLTGKLEEIGTLANNFPKSVRDVSNLSSKAPFTRFDLLGGGYSLLKMATNPLEGAAGTAAFLGPPGVRSGLMSGAYQNSLIPKAQSGLSAGINAAAPYAGLQAAQTGTFEQQLYKQLLGQQ